MKHRETELLEHYFMAPALIEQPLLIGTRLAAPKRMEARIETQQSEMDLICNAIKLGMPIQKHAIAGKVGIILKELRKRNIYQPHYEAMLNNLNKQK